MRGSLWALRKNLGIKGKKRRGRRAKPSDSVYVSRMTPEGASYLEEMNASDVWVQGSLIRYCEPPWFLTGVTPHDNLIEWESLIYVDTRNQYRAGRNGQATSLNPYNFARVLAKIAHSQAVADLGLDGFEPALLDLILGKNTRWPYLVGNAPINTHPNKDHDYFIKLFELDPPHSGTLLARIHPILMKGTPTYDVVVGRLKAAT